MKSKWILLSTLVTVLVLVLAVGLTQAQGPRPPEGAQPQGETGTLALVGTAFTYQGQLKKDGNAVSDTCDFRFSLWDSASGGAQIGTAQERTSVQVSNGLFTIPDLDFGAGAFRGDGRWLQIAVACTGDPGYVTLSPRQPLTPVPYALALPGLWTQQNVFSPNIIGGYSGNTVDAGVKGATIGGGGGSDGINSVAGDYGTVGGGHDNTASGFAATVGGGWQNTAGSQATIGGGVANSASGQAATVAGGNQNTANGYAATVSGGGSNKAQSNGATVGGGMNNTASGGNSVISGGAYNTASGHMAVIGGGYQNTAVISNTVIGGGGSNLITGTAPYATIAGGYNITVTAQFAAVGGGRNNTASNWSATVAGGEGNTASNAGATVGGGGNNTASGWNATVAGGGGNTASNTNAAVGGGYGNTASGGDATIAGGRLNTAGQRAAVGGGESNAAIALYATVPGGYAALADHYGQMAYASGNFSSNGDAQTSLYVMRNTSTGSNWVDLYLNGVFYFLTIASGRTMTFDILVVGRSDAGESAGYHIQGVIENVGGTVALIGTPAVTILGEDDAAWDVQVSPDDFSDALLVRVKGNGETIRWVATVRTAEVAW